MLRITVDIFSGRPNPVLELTGKEAAEALSRLQPVRKLKRTEPGLPAYPTLGYRGLIIEQVGEWAKRLPGVFRVANGDLFGPHLASKAKDEGFEDYVLGRRGLIGRLGLGEDFSKHLDKEIRRFKTLRDEYKAHRIPWPRKTHCRCAPLYEPTWWNDGGQKQVHNNCYNYATNYRTDTFAQPGRAAGAMYAALTCAAVKPAAVSDALIDTPAANNKCPDEGHLVALVIAPPGWFPQGDFHWYRKGRNGLWTHKPGSGAATNVDQSGHVITDPRTANRGPYTDFCTFMVVMHGHIKIN